MNLGKGYENLDQEDHNGSYLTASMTARSWSREDWQTRREMVAKVWDRKDELRRKELLAALVAHAPEAVVSE
jgi:hypothetical protein